MSAIIRRWRRKRRKCRMKNASAVWRRPSVVCVCVWIKDMQRCFSGQTLMNWTYLTLYSGFGEFAGRSHTDTLDAHTQTHMLVRSGWNTGAFWGESLEDKSSLRRMKRLTGSGDYTLQHWYENTQADMVQSSCTATCLSSEEVKLCCSPAS